MVEAAKRTGAWCRARLTLATAERGDRDVGRDHPGPWQLERERDRDRARAGAEVEDARARAGRSRARDRRFDQVLGLRPRHQRPAIDAERRARRTPSRRGDRRPARPGGAARASRSKRAASWSPTSSSGRASSAASVSPRMRARSSDASRGGAWNGDAGEPAPRLAERVVGSSDPGVATRRWSAPCHVGAADGASGRGVYHALRSLHLGAADGASSSAWKCSWMASIMASRSPSRKLVS